MLLSFQHISKSFLDFSIIKDFKTLQTLFFEVLAKKSEDRSSSLPKELYSIPYLNSSLFDPIALEREGKHIGGLDSMPVALFSHSILRDKRFKNKESLPLLEYLFEFLHAYDFTTTAKDIAEGVKQNHDKLINSAVLGLVFEKLNGYKEGSFYTPSFITSYMCKESITESLIEKFNSTYSWKCKNLEELREEMGIKGFREHKEEFFQTFLSLKICDPAVGSGHFLVSALNEMIHIAYSLRLIPALYESALELDNDEILIKTNNQLHQYTKPSSPIQKSHQIQEELFTLKKSIIENCLFGVDINPNSCEITKLRLWIELLKYSYYIFNEEGENTNALETLPNIDINIKCGNSLISYFDLNQSLTHYPNIRTKIQNYKNMVKNYKEGFFSDKTKLSSQIEELLTAFQKFCFKDKYKKEIQTFQKQCDKYRELYGNYLAKDDRDLALCISDNPFPVYEHIDETQEIHKQAKADFSNLKQAYNALYNLSSNNPFEWRFAFPEVLDEEGNFLGFDAIIGNPPYGASLTDFEKKKYKEIYKSSSSDTAQLFIFLADKLLAQNGINTFIVPKALTFASNWEQIRDFLKANVSQIVDCGKAWSYVLLEMIIYSKQKDKPTSSYSSGFLNEGEGLNQMLEIPKEYIDLFDFYPNDLTKEELEIGVRIRKEISHTLGDCGENVWGDTFYQEIQQEGEFKVYGGKEIQKYHIGGIKGFIPVKLKTSKKSFICENSVLMQRLIAHIENPFPHIKMTGTILREYEDIRIVNTIHQIICNENIPNHYVLACLHSKFLNWYCYRFTFAKAIRTFQFSAEMAKRIPIPKIDSKNKKTADKIIALVEEILKTKEKDPSSSTQELESQIDSLVYTLYGLSEEEIRMIEGGK